MPGLLDFFTGGGTEAQNQGLLAAAAQMLQASGPSTRPTSFGQVLGAGYGGYQQAQQQAQEQAYNALKMRGLQGELSDKDKARKDALAAQDWLRKYNQPDATAQARSVLGSNLSPTTENAALLSAAKPAAAPDQYTQRLAQAQAMRASGIPSLVAQADALEEHALKFRPKFSTDPKVGVGADNQPFTYVLDENTGLPKRLDGVLPRDKLELANLGGKDVAYNPFALQVGQTFNRTMTPDAVASNTLGRERLNFDKGQVGKPVFNAEAGGFITPPSKANPNGEIVPLAGMRGPKMTEDQGKATGWLVQAENAFANMKKVGLDKSGKPTAAAKPGFNDALAAIPSFGLTSGIANSFRGADRQKFMQASSSLGESLLRAATGAGVNKDEAKQKIEELTPIFGEDPEVTKQKFDAIPLYIDSLKVRAGPGAGLAAGVLAKKPGNAGAGGWSISRAD